MTFLCQIAIIYYKYIVLCYDSIARNSILVFAVMVFEKQVKSHGKVGVITVNPAFILDNVRCYDTLRIIFSAGFNFYQE